MLIFQNFDLKNLLIIIPLLIIFLTLHDYVQSVVAEKMGDKTAKKKGRLSLNPLVHLDIIGSVVALLTLRFGWTKAVPFDKTKFTEPRKGILSVALSGIITNFVIAFLLSVPLRVGFFSNISGTTFLLLFNSIRINLALTILNLIPLPPLDAFIILKEFLPAKFNKKWPKIIKYGPYVLLFLVLLTVLSRFINPWTDQLARTLMGF